MSFENGTIFSSPYCGSKFSKLILDFKTLAGVPVLKRFILTPKRFKDSPSNVAGKTPSGPLLYDVSPI